MGGDMALTGLHGKARSGKNTVGDILSKRGYVQMSFADPLKKIIDKYLGAVTRTEDDRDEVQEFFVYDKNLFKVGNYLGWDSTQTALFIVRFSTVMEQYRTNRCDAGDTYRVSYRTFIQLLGTDVCRHIEEGVWTRLLAEKLDGLDSDVVVTDVRFDNEAELIEQMSGYVVEVVNSNAKEYGHSSETRISDKYISSVIVNDSSLVELESMVYKLLEGEENGN
tara:strand:- start:55854 stop:56519 length:666 start_codon:yes stop_codon:yes gene_type:complete